MTGSALKFTEGWRTVRITDSGAFIEGEVQEGENKNIFAGGRPGG